MGAPRITPAMKTEIRKLRDKGWHPADIAEKFNVSDRTVYAHLRKNQKTKRRYKTAKAKPEAKPKPAKPNVGLGLPGLPMMETIARLGMLYAKEQAERRDVWTLMHLAIAIDTLTDIAEKGGTE